MAVSPQDVKKLRDQTGAGFGDCKEALEKAGGDFAAAEKLLKEKGLASVAKRSDRIANEGRVFSAFSSKGAGIMEVSCETDFVARNDQFITAGQNVLNTLVNAGAAAPGDDQIMAIKELAAKVKENLSIKKYKFIPVGSGEVLQDYIHGEGRIGVVVKISFADASKASDPKAKELAFDMALHVAAFNPTYLDRTQIDPKYLKEQEEILLVRDKDQLEGKPEKVVANIMKGKIDKFVKQICLIDQAFVKDDKMTVAQALEKAGKELGTKVQVSAYAYIQIGVEN